MRCKQGDLAWINKSIRQKNIGKVVTCKEYLGYFIEGENITEYTVAHMTDHFWLIESNQPDIEVLNGHVSTAYLPDLWLTPITPPPLEDDEDVDMPFELEDGLEKMA